MSIENLNNQVTEFLDKLNHPLRAEIELLRMIILRANSQLVENIKWNGPNYCLGDQDSLTMKIHPPKQVQLIFHRGAKRLAQPEEKLIEDPSGLLIWKENDRALVTFRSVAEVQKVEANLEGLINCWIEALK